MNKIHIEELQSAFSKLDIYQQAKAEIEELINSIVENRKIYLILKFNELNQLVCIDHIFLIEEHAKEYVELYANLLLDMNWKFEIMEVQL